MKQRICLLIFLLLLPLSSWTADSDRKHVVLDQSTARSAFPFSDVVLVGNTFYVAGTVGFDQTGKPPASAEEEARLAWTA